jgi:mRNA interferase HicA
MKAAKFKRQLASLGAQFVEGSNHTKVYLNGRQTILTRHGSQDMGPAWRAMILKQLDVNTKGE